MYLQRVLFTLIGSTTALIIVGCTGPTATPTFEVRPEPTVPPGYATYVDEQAGFQIFFPQSWEIDNRELDEMTAESLSFDGEDYAGDFRFVFEGGQPSGIDWNPYTTINVETLPSGETLDEYDAVSLNGLRNALPSYRLIKRSRIMVSDQVGSMFEGEVESQDYGLPPGDRFRLTQVLLMEGTLGWVITCSIFNASSVDDVMTCESVTRSLQILD